MCALFWASQREQHCRVGREGVGRLAVESCDRDDRFWHGKQPNGDLQQGVGAWPACSLQTWKMYLPRPSTVYRRLHLAKAFDCSHRKRLQVIFSTAITCEKYSGQFARMQIYRSTSATICARYKLNLILKQLLCCWGEHIIVKIKFYTLLSCRQDVSTRWNSTYLMFDRFLVLKQALLEMQSQQQYKDHHKALSKIKARDWALITNVVTVLKVGFYQHC